METMNVVHGQAQTLFILNIPHPQRVRLLREQESWHRALISALGPCSSPGPLAQAHRGTEWAHTEAGYTLAFSEMAQPWRLRPLIQAVRGRTIVRREPRRQRRSDVHDPVSRAPILTLTPMFHAVWTTTWDSSLGRWILRNSAPCLDRHLSLTGSRGCLTTTAGAMPALGVC